MIRTLVFLMSMSLSGCLFAVEVTWDGEGDDKEWFNPINWDGNIVPTALDDVVIPSSFIVNLDDDTEIQSLSLMGMLTIENSAVLGVFVPAQDGVTLVNGILVVDGTLNIALAGRHGINTFGTPLIIVSGKITINEVGNHGMLLINSAELRVSGTIDINDVKSHGIYMIQLVSVEMLPGSSLTIEHAQNGIEISDSFINNGTILISQPINNSSSTTGLSISVGGNLDNRLSGSIEIRGEFDRGIVNGGEIVNSGRITILESILSGLTANNSAALFNSGTLTINSSSGIGLLANSSEFENLTTGVIIISGMPEFRTCIRLNVSTMINNGFVSLSSFEGDGFSILDDGSFLNFGDISIAGTESQRIVANQGSFLNDTDASIVIEVDQVSQVIENTGAMLNRGAIDCEGVFLDKFLMSSGADTFFENSGLLNVGALSMTNPILVQESSSFVNSGEITMAILSFTGIGVEVSGDSSMTNTSNGDFILDVMGASPGDPMYVELGSVFEDLGLFDIRMN